MSQNPECSENLRKKYKILIEAYTEKIRTFKKEKQPVQTVPQDILECLKMILDTIEIMLNMFKSINREENKVIKEKRELPASLKEALKTNQYIAKELDTNICPSILKFVSIFRGKAKENIENKKDFETINNNVIQLFNEYLKINGKEKVLLELNQISKSIAIK